MINLIKQLLGMGSKTNYAELVKNGAVIVDVRTKGEYSSGHIKGSINIPLDSISNVSSKVKDKKKVIITCCASGMRSASAKSTLQNMGYTTVYNGGGWYGLDSKIKE